MPHENSAVGARVLRGGIGALVGALLGGYVISWGGLSALGMVSVISVGAGLGLLVGLPGGIRFRWFRRGAAVAVVGTFPLAALCALLFRFPVPFAAYASGPNAVLPALAAVLMYGILGGFVVQGLVGGLAGMAAATGTAPSERSRWRVCVALSLAGASLGVLLLSVLDYIIGPW